MYANVHESMYDGTLRDCWEAVAVWPHILVLSAEQGILDMTPAAIHHRTGLPLDIVEKGVAFLENRQWLRGLDNHRKWGWTVETRK